MCKECGVSGRAWFVEWDLSSSPLSRTVREPENLIEGVDLLRIVMWKILISSLRVAAGANPVSKANELNGRRSMARDF